MRVFVEIHIPRLPSEKRELMLQGYTLGSDERDSLRVSTSSGLLPGAYYLRVSEAGVEISASSEDSPSIAHDGRHLRATHVRFGEEVFLGSTRLGFVSSTTLTTPQRQAPFFVAVALLGISTGGLFLVGEDLSDAAAEETVPPLFAKSEPCETPSGETAERWFDVLMERAQAKAARFAFARRDGVRGVKLALAAEACAASGKEATRAEVARSFRTTLEERVTDEYLSLQLRLRAAREQGRHKEALGAVTALDDMLDEAGLEEGIGYRKKLLNLRSSLTRRLDEK